MKTKNYLRSAYRSDQINMVLFTNYIYIDTVKSAKEAKIVMDNDFIVIVQVYVDFENGNKYCNYDCYLKPTEKILDELYNDDNFYANFCRIQKKKLAHAIKNQIKDL